MFETCSSLGELNQERQERMRAGVAPLDINAAYNRAKRIILESTPTFRKIPTYVGEPLAVRVYMTLPMLPGQGNQNEIIITPTGVLL